MKKKRTLRLPCLLLALCLLLGGQALAAPEGAVVWGYSEGLAQCEYNGKWGFVDAQKRVVIPLKYNSVVSFSMGLAAVNLDGKLGVIRPDGTYLIQPEYGTLLPLDCGLYVVQKGTRWGVASILPFSDGQGGTTNLLYDLIYDSATITEQGGTRVLTLTRDGEVTKIPVFELPRILVEKGVPSARFSLTRGKLPDFSDVSPRDWFAVWVDIAYNVGLTSGVGGNRYAPEQTLTVAEVLKLAATMESRYKDDSFHTSSSTGPYWYSGAVNYCLASGIIQSGTFSQKDYLRPATRREIAQIFAATSQAKHMKNINDLSRIKVSVPDVKPGDPGADAIYSLYAKGVLTGVDSKLTFNPKGTVTRAEAAAIVARMARAEQRLTLWGTFNPNVLAA
ncbi:WG repeat-containing protein [uncultured Flavonifractor sp.]|uniref:WG repeat-containing protein n=1 Tax=uncultured Flavonifractor sp. TaxID=1193534 RepID=UPI00267012A1|nr:WG repeat-containing protein [uncultured Flavonifractor sp.]